MKSAHAGRVGGFQTMPLFETCVISALILARVSVSREQQRRALSRVSVRPEFRVRGRIFSLLAHVLYMYSINCTDYFTWRTFGDRPHRLSHRQGLIMTVIARACSLARLRNTSLGLW